MIAILKQFVMNNILICLILTAVFSLYVGAFIGRWLNELYHRIHKHFTEEYLEGLK